MERGGEKRRIRFLLTGGGTGGHLFPALAAAEEMCSRFPGTEVLFIGTRRKMDRSSLTEAGYRVSQIYAYGIKGKGLLQLAKALAVLPVSLVQAAVRIISFKPDVVLGVGGYVTGPVMVAAKLLGKKTVIHEQNSIPGLANRQLGRLVDRVCISLPGSARFFPPEKTVMTGNPVRKQICALAGEPQAEQNKKPTLLILGGSQGAHRVNELVVEALCEKSKNREIRVIHQTGPADAAMVRKRYGDASIDCVVESFFRNMDEMYRRADLLVSRAGATTLAEIAVVGRPAILIPYPHAADDHQHGNADYYVKSGGCVKFSEGQLDAEILWDTIADLLSDRQKLDEMAAQMKSLGVAEAAERIVDVCIESATTP